MELEGYSWSTCSYVVSKQLKVTTRRCRACRQVGVVKYEIIIFRDTQISHSVGSYRKPPCLKNQLDSSSRFDTIPQAVQLVTDRRTQDNSIIPR